jgi:hypothetical protein
MGLKISFKPSKTFTWMAGREITNLHNWRAVIENYRKDINGIAVVTREYRCIFLEGMTFNEFNYLNSTNAKISIPFGVIKNYLICKKCFGSGKTDWVQAPRGSTQPRSSQNPFVYNRKERIITIAEYDGVTYSLSKPNIKPGEELCSSCLGSGIFFKGELKFIKEEELNKS